MLIISIMFSILVCFAIPIGGAIYLRKKGTATVKTFLFGALAFFMSQICIRLPLLSVAAGSSWYVRLQYQPLLYGLFLGLTAGIAEEVARWIFLRFALKKCRSREDGLLFGLGHGGIEAMLLVGINMVVCLIVAFAGQGEQLGASPLEFFLAGIERLYAMTFHVGATLIVLHGIRSARSGRYLLLAIALHMIFDAAIVILPAYFGTGVIGLTIWGIVCAVVILVGGWKLFSSDNCIS